MNYHLQLFIIVFHFACLESTSKVLGYLKPPQAVTLLVVSGDLRISWSVGILSMVLKKT